MSKYKAYKKGIKPYQFHLANQKSKESYLVF